MRLGLASTSFPNRKPCFPMSEPGRHLQCVQDCKPVKKKKKEQRLYKREFKLLYINRH